MLPQEVELWYVLPVLRAMIAKEMIGLGLTQRKIAEKLGITESAVSQYLSGKRAKAVDFDEKTIKKIKESAKWLAKSEKSFTSEAMQLCNIIRKSGMLCKIHRQYGETEKNCEVCLR